jgi:hypothetical protein
MIDDTFGLAGFHWLARDPLGIQERRDLARLS